MVNQAEAEVELYDNEEELEPSLQKRNRHRWLCHIPKNPGELLDRNTLTTHTQELLSKSGLELRHCVSPKCTSFFRALKTSSQAICSIQCYEVAFGRQWKKGTKLRIKRVR